MDKMLIDGVGIIGRSLRDKAPNTKKMLRYLPNYCYFQLVKSAPQAEKHVVLPMIDASVQESLRAQAMVKRIEPKAINLYKAQIAPDCIIKKAERIVLDFNPGIEYETPEFERLVEQEVRTLMSSIIK